MSQVEERVDTSYPEHDIITVVNTGQHAIKKGDWVYAVYMHGQRILIGFSSKDKPCEPFDNMMEGWALSTAGPGEQLMLGTKTYKEQERLWNILITEKLQFPNGRSGGM